MPTRNGPSGKEWDKYRKTEEAYWKKHNKGSGRYFTWNGQRWRLDPKSVKNGQRVFSPKSVDVKNTENKRIQSTRSNRISGQTDPKANTALTEKKTAQINASGKQAHHIVPLYRAEGLSEKYGGQIPDNVRQKFADQRIYFGDDPRNIMGLNPPAHSSTHSTEAAMDAALKNPPKAPSVAELVKNPTKNFPIYEVGGGVVKKVAPKLAKTAAKFVPVVGSALVFNELGQRAQAAEQNPTALNQLQAGISSLEAAAEGASLAAYGSGIGAGLGVAADVVSLGLGLTNGAIDTVRDLVGSRRRDP